MPVTPQGRVQWLPATETDQRDLLAQVRRAVAAAAQAQGVRLGVRDLLRAPAVTARLRQPERLRFMPGQLIVQLKGDALRRSPAGLRASAAGSVAARQQSLGEPVESLFEHLRNEHGLKGVTPLFGGAHPGGAAAASAAGHRAALLSTLAPDRDWSDGYVVLTMRDAGNEQAALAALGKHGAVALAERMPARYLAAARKSKRKADPMINRQWGLRAIDWFRAKRPSAGAVRVAVLDTGIDDTHPDLSGCIEQYDHFQFSAEDIVGHGTHVAGTIAAAVNNGLGVAGVADCKLSVWKIFDDKPYRGEYYVDGVSYLRALRAALNAGVQVVNLSITGEEQNRTEAGLFERMFDAGIFVCAAMGNYFEEGNPTFYPAAYKRVFAVGAVDEVGRRAAFSNTGRHIFVSAPGNNILSTVPMQASPARAEVAYAAWSGTSMATPHLSGTVALLRAKFPKHSVDQLANRLKRTSLPAALQERGFTPEFGHGVISAARALR